ncbi:MAG: shikimate kinase [Lentisphaeria bacterium]|nr:shikimate kinase [Lentisphaeria bacterium]
MATDYIFMIGPRACGKTGVGNSVATKLDDWTAFDLDTEYERICFMETGQRLNPDPDEYYNRSREILFEYLCRDNIVMCLGGGTLINSHSAPDGCIETLNKCRERGQVILVLPSRFDFRNRKILYNRERQRRYSVTAHTVAEHYDKRIGFFRNNADLIVYSNDLDTAADKIIKHYGLGAAEA